MERKKYWTKDHLVDIERRAIDLRNAGRFQEAAGLFSMIVKQQTDWEHGTGFYELAVCYEDMGDLKLAGDSYKAALRYQPANRDFLGGFASFLYLHGDPESALNAHLELLEVNRMNNDDIGVERTTTAIKALGIRLGLSDAAVNERINNGLL